MGTHTQSVKFLPFLIFFLQFHITHNLRHKKIMTLFSRVFQRTVAALLLGVVAVSAVNCAFCGRDLYGRSTGMVPIIQNGKHNGEHATYHYDPKKFPDCRAAHDAADKKACNAATPQFFRRRNCTKCGGDLYGRSTGMVPVLQNGKHSGNATYHLDKPECRKAHDAAQKKACDAATAQRRRRLEERLEQHLEM